MVKNLTRGRALTAALTLAALTACAPPMVWVMDGITPAQRDSDHAYCRSQAHIAAGPYRAPPSSGGYQYGRDYDHMYQPLAEGIRNAGHTMSHALAHEAYINDLTHYCMQALGYRQVPEEEAPQQTQN